jgi:hypothetical protein
MNEYEKQANDFLKETQTIITIKFLKWDKHFNDDKENRDIYKITLKRGSREYAFNFGQSLAKSGIKIKHPHGVERNITEKLTDKDTKTLRENKKLLIGHSTISGFGQYLGYPLISKDKVIYPEIPSNYDILACLTTNNPIDFENFCLDYGYDTDSRKAEKIYKAVCEEWNNIKMLYSDEEITKLQEIQ